MEERTKENRRRIIDLEQDVGGLKVDMGKISVGFDASERRAEERHRSSQTSQIEIRNLIQHRIEMDASKERDQREHQQEAEKANRAWKQSLVNPQTVVIVLAIILGLFGMKVSDVMLPPSQGQAGAP